MIEITWKDGGAVLAGEQMEPSLIFNCGQAFRFEEQEAGVYRGIAYGRQIWCRKTKNGMELFPVTPEEMEKIWKGYFDLDFCYPPEDARFSSDAVLREAAQCCAGLRILRQEPFETIITFILSANNNIARIRGIVKKLCELAGEPIAPGCFAFPAPQALAGQSEEALRACGAGYRARYVLKTARKVAEGYDLERFYGMEYAAARAELCELNGVGPKVADCILLFAYQKREAFPADVWIRRMLGELYGFAPKNDKEILQFASEHFGEYGGLAQQYLFHYMRTQAKRKE
jgi:N-glycosylase/DNA lyase